MELRGREGDVFAIVRRVNNIYPREFKVMNPRLAAWIDNGRHGTTHQEVVERLEGVDTTATAEGGTGTEAALMTWYGDWVIRRSRRAQNGASGTVITDLPVKIPGFNACAACVVGKSVRLPHKERREGASIWNGTIPT